MGRRKRRSREGRGHLRGGGQKRQTKKETQRHKHKETERRVSMLGIVGCSSRSSSNHRQMGCKGREEGDAFTRTQVVPQGETTLANWPLPLGEMMAVANQERRCSSFCRMRNSSSFVRRRIVETARTSCRAFTKM